MIEFIAKIIRSSQKNFDCQIQEGEQKGTYVKATALGSLLKGCETLVVGDHVCLEKSSSCESSNEYTIKRLLPRKNEIFRIIVRENKKKVTASNCDYLIILNSVSKPVLKTGIIDRFLVRAYQWGIEPLVVFNKMDQYDSKSCDILFEQERLSPLGVSCFEISAKEPEYKNQFLSLGLDDLREKLKGKTTIFLGQSGVGKSRTISELTNQEVELKINKVGKGGKGSHTTSWSEIIDFNGLYLIDSPGIRSFSLEDVDPQDLINYFPDLLPISLKCKFSDCVHDDSTPGCGFFLTGSMTKALNSRLKSYQKLVKEVSSTPEWDKKM